jgi:hypothetical protein
MPTSSQSCGNPTTPSFRFGSRAHAAMIWATPPDQALYACKDPRLASSPRIAARDALHPPRHLAHAGEVSLASARSSQPLHVGALI